ncbi:hypothetical protein FACS1894181_10560 [Bacteroidia bacterium]|nr:hypothetical protein FACS1894181_10560 [Bacteroidia bacterium]
MKSWKINKITTNNRTEFYIALKPEKNSLFPEQLDSLLGQYGLLLDELGLDDGNLMFAKVFVSDFLNQVGIMNEHPLFKGRLSNGAVSIIEQPPLDGSKVNLLLWFVKSPGMKKYKREGATFVETGGYVHIFQPVRCGGRPSSNMEKQTEDAFAVHKELLRQHDMAFAGHCVRTWLYVKDIDKDYAGVVKGRNNFFRENGLNADTHFIASTGIGGSGESPDMGLCIDFYSVKGLEQGQVKYLQALDYLNPTYEYGVSFERGTCVTYPDVRHIFISGTASIDKHGRCIHEGNVVQQLERIFVNIEHLLHDAGAGLEDMVQMIVYIRDIADAEVVGNYLAGNFDNIPSVLVQGRVCRPQWLVEVECIAARKVCKM